MKLCARHLTDLNSMLGRKGLAHLIRDDTEQNRLCAEAWLRGTASREQFDPRIVGIFEIYQKARELGIPAVGDRCPICTVPLVLQNAQAGDAWIDNVTDALVICARVNGLMKG